MDVSRPSLDLHIDELVLHGFEPRDRYAVAEALQRELGELLAGRGLPAHVTGATHLSLQLGAVELPHGAPPAAVGVEVARALHRGLGWLGRAGT